MPAGPPPSPPAQSDAVIRLLALSSIAQRGLRATRNGCNSSRARCRQTGQLQEHGYVIFIQPITSAIVLSSSSVRLYAQNVPAMCSDSVANHTTRRRFTVEKSLAAVFSPTERHRLPKRTIPCTIWFGEVFRHALRGWMQTRDITDGAAGGGDGTPLGRRQRTREDPC